MEKVRELEIWEEAVGELRKVMVHHDAIFVYLSIVSILKIPYQKGLLEKLKRLKGKEVGILHTDIEGKEYLLREVKNNGE